MTTDAARRRLLKAAGVATLGAWTTPVIEAIQIPVHAQGSPVPPPPTTPQPPTTPPPVLCEDVRYDGPNPVTLADAGEDTELAFVQTFLPGAVFVRRAGPLTTACWTATESYAVVLVKAGTDWWVYTGVQVGDSLCTSGQAISHLSKFACPPED
jgi:hypothetical protein